MRVQQEGETVDAYVTALKTLAKTCNFGQLQHDLLKDRIAIGITDNATKKEFLNMRKLTQKECIDKCRRHESTSIQIKTMTEQEVSAVSTRLNTTAQINKRNLYMQTKAKKSIVFSLARSMPKIESNVDHGEKVFHMPQTKSFLSSLQISEQASSHVSIIDQDTFDQDDYVVTPEEIDIVIYNSNPNKVFVTLSVNDKEEHFQIDTRAT